MSNELDTRIRKPKCIATVGRDGHRCGFPQWKDGLCKRHHEDGVAETKAMLARREDEDAIRCEHCRYWEDQRRSPEEVIDNEGLCRRYPPILMPEYYDSNVNDVFFSQPSSNHSDWCGEFQWKGRVSHDKD